MWPEVPGTEQKAPVGEVEPRFNEPYQHYLSSFHGIIGQRLNRTQLIMSSLGPSSRDL
jgi:hypothetical protein